MPADQPDADGRGGHEGELHEQDDEEYREMVLAA
jgi:hypothetical protein